MYSLTASFMLQKKDQDQGFVCRECFNSWLPLPVWQRNKRKAARRISGTASELGGINLSRQGDTLTNTDLSIEHRDFSEFPDSQFVVFWGVITFRLQVPLPCLSN